jgi:hypothetical protein
MRRLVVLCTLLALALPLAANASTRAAGDGTLAVRDLNGMTTGVSLEIRARGGLIGRCDQCAFRLEDRTLTEVAEPVVTGAERSLDIDGDGNIEFFSGRDVRWKIVAGAYMLRIRSARDVDLSVVGQGSVRIRGTDGVYAVNEGEAKPVPPAFAVFSLGTAPAAP